VVVSAGHNSWGEEQTGPDPAEVSVCLGGGVSGGDRGGQMQCH
jgi:hypothetical protein